MMNLVVQIFSMFFSFIYGVFLYFMFVINYKYLFRKKYRLKLFYYFAMFLFVGLFLRSVPAVSGRKAVRGWGRQAAVLV